MHFYILLLMFLLYLAMSLYALAASNKRLKTERIATAKAQKTALEFEQRCDVTLALCEKQKEQIKVLETQNKGYVALSDAEIRYAKEWQNMFCGAKHELDDPKDEVDDA